VERTTIRGSFLPGEKKNYTASLFLSLCTSLSLAIFIIDFSVSLVSYFFLPVRTSSVMYLRHSSHTTTFVMFISVASSSSVSCMLSLNNAK